MEQSGCSVSVSWGFIYGIMTTGNLINSFELDKNRDNDCCDDTEYSKAEISYCNYPFYTRLHHTTRVVARYISWAINSVALVPSCAHIKHAHHYWPNNVEHIFHNCARQFRMKPRDISDFLWHCHRAPAISIQQQLQQSQQWKLNGKTFCYHATHSHPSASLFATHAWIAS